ncbi:glutaminyl-peptide cyclotransferase [Rufibacter glacialis]|uniref:Glutaminyl-peptide cyclotransferase n=1 Tax=Rufibacter glacialis TaxID=1259555 RepID=A0A5M8QTB1_9BACT|nr:glutaminyl-peptide cyclotransferase [Rufibacter glacialis]
MVGCANDHKKPAPLFGSSKSSANHPAVPLLNYSVVKAYPHDTTVFTQGLLVHEGHLYESTGSPEYLPHSRSMIGVVNLETGTLEVKAELDRQTYFGEGIAVLHGKMYQLTYLTNAGFVYDLPSFKKTGQFTFPSKEGWGMTTDGTHLIMSDGTNRLTYLNPTTFKAEKYLAVTEGTNALENLNELEYINGYLYANVYTTNTIVKIDPATGKVVAKLDLSSLKKDAKAKQPRALELNGIAYDDATDKIYVTGKLWPHLYEIKFPH